MGHDILGAIAAFVLGVAVSFANYLISRTALRKRSKLFSSVASLRMVINLIFLILLYFASSPLGFDATYCLIGGGLGLTLSLFLFTSLLLRQGRSITDTDERDSGEEKKEGTDD